MLDVSSSNESDDSVTEFTDYVIVASYFYTVVPTLIAQPSAGTSLLVIFCPVYKF